MAKKRPDKICIPQDNATVKVHFAAHGCVKGQSSVEGKLVKGATEVPGTTFKDPPYWVIYFDVPNPDTYDYFQLLDETGKEIARTKNITVVAGGYAHISSPPSGSTQPSTFLSWGTASTVANVSGSMSNGINTRTGVVLRQPTNTDLTWVMNFPDVPVASGYTITVSDGSSSDSTTNITIEVSP
jgi:hypothetical protein